MTSIDQLRARLVVSGMALLGMSLVLLLRSPFRMPLGERIFRAIWLGPVGRTFLRVAGLGLGRTGGRAGATAPGMTRATRVTRPAAPSSAAIVDGAGDRIAALETRLAELERWRETH